MVQHAGGWVKRIGDATKPYYFRLLEDAEFEQQDGDMVFERGARVIMEKGSTITFTGDDAVYDFSVYPWDSFIARGTSTQGCTLHGSDDSNKISTIRFGAATVVKCNYLTIEHAHDGSQMIYDFPWNFGIFTNCTFTGQSGTYMIRRSGGGSIIFENCLFEDCGEVFVNHRYGISILIDCSIDQTSNVQISNENYNSYIAHNGITWLNATPSEPINNDYGYSGNHVEEIQLKTFTINEGNTLTDCQVVVRHQKYDELNDLSDETSLNAFSHDIFMKGFNLLQQSKNTDGSGQVKIYVPWKLWLQTIDGGGATHTAYEISESGASNPVDANGYYELFISKEGYRTQSTTYWGSSDQTWNVTLVEQADFDDILDVLGTPADFDSGATIADNLKDLADDNGGADYDPSTDSLEVISDKIGTPKDWGTGATVSDMLKDIADDNGGNDFNPTDDSLVEQFDDVDTSLTGIVAALGLIWTDTTDIITDLDDVKGTGFVVDTDSLVDLSHKAGVKGTDAIYDLVAGMASKFRGWLLKPFGPLRKG